MTTVSFGSLPRSFSEKRSKKKENSCLNPRRRLRMTACTFLVRWFEFTGAPCVAWSELSDAASELAAAGGGGGGGRPRPSMVPASIRPRLFRGVAHSRFGITLDSCHGARPPPTTHTAEPVTPSSLFCVVSGPTGTFIYKVTGIGVLRFDDASGERVGWKALDGTRQYVDWAEAWEDMTVPTLSPVSRVGSGSGLNLLPLDVLDDIAEHLGVAEVAQLSRCSRRLHTVLAESLLGLFRSGDLGAAHMALLPRLLSGALRQFPGGSPGVATATWETVLASSPSLFGVTPNGSIFLEVARCHSMLVRSSWYCVNWTASADGAFGDIEGVFADRCFDVIDEPPPFASNVAERVPSRQSSSEAERIREAARTASARVSRLEYWNRIVGPQQVDAEQGAARVACFVITDLPEGTTGRDDGSARGTNHDPTLDGGVVRHSDRRVVFLDIAARRCDDDAPLLTGNDLWAAMCGAARGSALANALWYGPRVPGELLVQPVIGRRVDIYVRGYRGTLSQVTQAADMSHWWPGWNAAVHHHRFYMCPEFVSFRRAQVDAMLVTTASALVVERRRPPPTYSCM